MPDSAPVDSWNPWVWLAEATGCDSEALKAGLREGGYAIVSRQALRRLGWRGFCDNVNCGCWVPGDVCEEFMGGGKGRCPRCGWKRSAHDEP